MTKYELHTNVNGYSYVYRFNSLEDLFTELRAKYEVQWLKIISVNKMVYGRKIVLKSLAYNNILVNWFIFKV